MTLEKLFAMFAIQNKDNEMETFNIAMKMVDEMKIKNI